MINRLCFLALIIMVPYTKSLAETSLQEVGRLDIYSATDLRAISPVLVAFKDKYPDIKVVYREFDTQDLYHAIKAKSLREQPDVVISSAMDLQVHLVNDGYAQPIMDSAVNDLPSWANWRNEAIGFTYEPIVFVYNKATFKNKLIPLTHESLAEAMRNDDDFFAHKVGSYDARRSGLGYFVATQDEVTSSISGRLQESLGRAHTQVYGRTAKLLDDISSGKLIFGYNMLGSYSLAREKQDSRIGVVIPQDYALVVSRVAYISKQAKHASNAQRFLSFLISTEGQQVLASKSELMALNPNINALRDQSINFHPIPLGPALMVYLDDSKRRRFIKAWESALLSIKGE
ncbi:ABC transporter substrate-binding protein [Marinomonas posidonica]|uniref:Extracellular solute-binding protein family 1 n=1 Tax=Marinomonas posidonica (strain CECT 7376 / NCIMB 14433 / IVIA-Po-181) TaxID=491952 RepID=F6CVP7_MARPP|nr:ABC transporter substrate-binding protein [Marinomonas posidonica]AEF56521.1 extracellular solute-binding protein family 1 [Marinomonas posidonica IVIA-Po-181]